MIPRYQTEFMNQLFLDEQKYYQWFLVEIAHLQSQLSFKKQNDPALIKRLYDKASTIDWSAFAKKVAVFEKDTRHDVIAFLHALEEELGADARMIHLGLTSSDVVDTAFSKLLSTAGSEILRKLSGLIKEIFLKAEANKGVACLGRTHGQAAEPMTFSIKLLGHACELHRSFKRITAAVNEISVGKLSGAVGVYAHTGPEVEAEALKLYGLFPETVSTQVVARDRHAAFFSSLAVLAGSMERLALEIRLLMHGEVAEVSEAFLPKQKGSSAMPHKKNPILSENICGLMRLVRSYALSALENQALWHERDISHSSVERVIAPDCLNIMDFSLDRLKNIIKNLEVFPEKMAENLSSHSDSLLSQAAMLSMVEGGMMRQQAYEIVQEAVMKGKLKEKIETLGLKLSQADHAEEMFFERVKVYLGEVRF